MFCLPKNRVRNRLEKVTFLWGVIVFKKRIDCPEAGEMKKISNTKNRKTFFIQNRLLMLRI